LSFGVEGASITIATLSLVLTVTISFFVIPMGNRARKIEALESDAQSSARASAAQERQNIRTELGAATAEIKARVAAIESRLVAGDAHLRILDERDHSLELKVLQAISDLKDVVATKDDLKRIREELNRA